jgi:hypothetical protein
MINLTLEVAGKKFKSEGQNVNEAMSKLDLKWTDVKGKGILTVNNGKITFDKIFYLKQMRRMFGNKLGKIFRTTWANRFELQLRESQ